MRPGVAFVPFAIVATALSAVLLAGCTSSTSGSPADPGSSAPVSSAPVSVGPSISTPGTSSPTSPTSPPVSVSTAVPADVPTTGPNLLHKGERPPVMPELATEHTPAGAVAFARFFIRTIDWGYATTSTAYMKHYYEPSCITCTSIAKAVDGQAAKQHHFRGDRLSIRTAGVSDQSGASVTVTVRFRVSSVEVVDDRGAFVDASPAVTLSNAVTLRWLSRQWLVTDVVAQR
jgi:hypothetical protein